MRIRKNLAILTLQFDEVTVKTIYNNNIINVNDIKSKTTRFSEMGLLKTINSHFLTEHGEKGQIPTFSSPKITLEQVKVTQSKRRRKKEKENGCTINVQNGYFGYC